VAIVEVKVPVLAESVADAVLLEWYKHAGEAVEEGEKLVDIETDKVVLEVVAPQSGTLSELLKPSGEHVASEEVIAQIDTEAVAQTPSSAQKTASESSAQTPSTAQSSEPSAQSADEQPVQSSAAAKTSPAVRKRSADQSIDLTTIAHQGDRITKADVLNYQQPETVKSSSAAPATRPGSRPEERVPMTRLRQRIAQRLLKAQHEHAILTTFNEVNMMPVMALRNRYKEHFEKKYGIKLGLMSFFSKAAVAALKQFPIINASIEGEEVIYHGYYDIGIAVSTDQGLVVPILRDVDALSFAEIERGIANFAQRARDTQLTLDDLSGGTFTITNGGIFGSMLSTPILNPPQSAILGMHNIVERPIAEQGQVVIRPVMYVALSYDHRLIDGRQAVQFLVTIKQAIEDPARLLLEL